MNDLNPQLAIDSIRQFFDKKVQTALLAEYKDILKTAKKDANTKKLIDTLSKSYDAYHHVQLKVQQLQAIQKNWQAHHITDTEEELSQLLAQQLEQSMTKTQADNEFIEDSTMEDKKSMDKFCKDWLKKLNKTQLDQSHKTFCAHQLDNKFKADEMAKNSYLIEQLKSLNPQISSLIIDKKQALQAKFEPNQWLDEASKNAGNVSIKKTHISKLTHSSASSVNINGNEYQALTNDHENNTANTQGLLTTQAIHNPSFDFAYSSAGFASIADFLRTPLTSLEPSTDICIGEAICADLSVLMPFATDEQQANEWQQSFKLAFDDKAPIAHELLKQVYFPISNGSHSDHHDYHLLCPLMSSTLAQAIDDRIWQTRQKDMPARIARRNRQYSELADISYPTTAKIQVTQSNHQNVSNLNGKRTGRLMLLSSAPPPLKQNQDSKQNSLTGYFTKDGFFNNTLAYKVRTPLARLRKMLFALQQKELKQNLQRKQYIRQLIEEIVNEVLLEVAIVQDFLAQNPDTDISQLPRSEQYWLNCFHSDSDWQHERQSVNWQESIAESFAKWINQALQHPYSQGNKRTRPRKQLSLGTRYRQQWQKILSPMLMAYIAETEAYRQEKQQLNKKLIDNQDDKEIDDKDVDSKETDGKEIDKNGHNNTVTANLGV